MKDFTFYVGVGNGMASLAMFCGMPFIGHPSGGTSDTFL